MSQEPLAISVEKLRKDLHTLIGERVRIFRAETDASPSAITVSMVKVSNNQHSQHVVAYVDVVV